MLIYPFLVKSFRIKREVDEDLGTIIDIKRKVFLEVFEQTRPSLTQKELLLNQEENILFSKEKTESFTTSNFSDNLSSDLDAFSICLIEALLDLTTKLPFLSVY